MISLNIEREMKLRALAKHLADRKYCAVVPYQDAMDILKLLDEVDLSTQEAWMAEERLREAEMTAVYSREAC